MFNKILLKGVLLLLLVITVPLYSQDSAQNNPTVSLNQEGSTNPVITDPSLIGQPSWGVADGSNLWLHAAEFAPMFGQTAYWIYPGYIYKSAGAGQSFCASLHQLQRGAYINGIDVVYYDGDASYNIHVFLQRMYGETSPDSDQPWDFLSAGNPGYRSDYTSVNLTYDPWDGAAWHAFWWICVDFPITGNTLRFRGLRIYYHLQVSPAPSTATFTDVPTSHPFFQFVEALADSGITTGCSATQYCPNNYVTRGQMAVFLARIVGLHWSL